MMDHRLALVLWVALLVLAAAPLAYAWVRLLPEERLPFEIEDKGGGVPRRSTQARHDPFAIFLLALVTVSYLMKIPGMPVGTALQWLARVLPEDYFEWAVIGGRVSCVVTPGLAAVYGAVRRNPIRLSLALGGILVLILWLASPHLRFALNS